MERWLITGAGGLLGREVAELLRHDGAEVITLDRQQLDLCDADAVRAALIRYRPDTVVNAAAWTAADEAESLEEKALAINGTSVRGLARGCASVDARLIHISTDYVFGGDATTTPYSEHAAPSPCNAYGRTKLVGERAVTELLPDSGYVLRTAWLYGSYGRSFVRTMIRLERQREILEVVDDQRGQPTWAGDVAIQILRVRRREAPPGIYHATNSGGTTWHGLACEVFGLLGADPERIRPISSSAWAGAARRPAYSVLGHGRWTEVNLPAPRHWRSALVEAFPAMLEADLLLAVSG
jgi:dTDP-4-dehydrorhamnose reductase